MANQQIQKSNNGQHNSNLTPLQQKQLSFKKTFEKALPAITEVLPKHLDAERMFRVYLMAIQQSPGILDCVPVSVIGAVLRAAQFGLSLETVTGEAYIIPRRSKHANNQKVANFQIGYKGLIKLAKQGDPRLLDIFAYPVFENDDFEYTLGLNPNISVHKPAASGARGKLVYAYAIAVWDNYRRFRVVDPDEIADAMRSAGGTDKDDSPWRTHTPSMWCKTALLRLCSQMSLRSDVALTIARDGSDGTQLLREHAQQGSSNTSAHARTLLADLGVGAEVEDVGDEEEQSGDALGQVAARVEKQLEEKRAHAAEPLIGTAANPVVQAVERDREQAAQPQRAQRRRASES